MPGEHPEQYVLENDNGAKAIVRTFGANLFTYITKDGIEVMGKRKDAADIKSEAKPYAGGAPHCFPQVSTFVTSSVAFHINHACMHSYVSGH